MSFRLGKCRVSISFFFFALTAAAAVLNDNGTLFSGIMAALFHEIGHMVAIMLSPEIRVTAFSVNPFGLQITSHGGERKTSGWKCVCVAGAAANLAVGALFFAAMLICDSSDGFALKMTAANLGLAAVNILPVMPLDGGQLLRAFMAPLGDERAEKLSFAFSLIVSVPILTAGFRVLLRSKGNFSLLLLGMWLITCFLRDHFC